MVSIRNQDVEFAALRQQVSSLESDYRDLKAVVVGLDKKIDNSFKSLAEKIDKGQKTPWGAIWDAAGVIVSTITVVGYLAMQRYRERRATSATTCRRKPTSALPKTSSPAMRSQPFPATSTSASTWSEKRLPFSKAS